MRPTALTGLVFALCLSGPLLAGAEPADATVFIRLTGHVRVLSGGDRIRREVLLDLPQVEVGTGSGFIVSSQGWVLTNHHVITGTKLDAVIDGVAVVIAIEVERIEVVLPREGGSPGGASHRYVASVYASDPDLDLAVLSISAPELPVVSLGDSDVVAMGDAVSAIGYPFGSQLEIGKAQPSDAVPDVSVNAGSVSALRRNDAGDLRYLQTSAQLNPGNSGGPLVDADGYAVAVAQLAVQRGAGVGFGVPINLVKAYLQRLGLDRALPDNLLTLGPQFDEDQGCPAAHPRWIPGLVGVATAGGGGRVWKPGSAPHRPARNPAAPRSDGEGPALGWRLRTLPGGGRCPANSAAG